MATSLFADPRVVWREDDCIVWTGTGTRPKDDGYGQVRQRGRRYVTHRVAYEQAVGPIPPGLTLDHLCGVKRCLNPLHLEPVTSRENSLRGGNLCAQRARQTHCLRDHELAGDNVYITSQGSRQCRECVRLNNQRRRVMV